MTDTKKPEQQPKSVPPVVDPDRRDRFEWTSPKGITIVRKKKETP